MLERAQRLRALPFEERRKWFLNGAHAVEVETQANFGLWPNGDLPVRFNGAANLSGLIGASMRLNITLTGDAVAFAFAFSA